MFNYALLSVSDGNAALHKRKRKHENLFWESKRARTRRGRSTGKARACACFVQFLFDRHPQGQRRHVESLPFPLLAAVPRVVGVEVYGFGILDGMAPALSVAFVDRFAVADWYAVYVVHGEKFPPLLLRREVAGWVYVCHSCPPFSRFRHHQGVPLGGQN